MRPIHVLILACAFLQFACTNNTADENETNKAVADVVSTTLKIQSRGVGIPATLVTPGGGSGEKFPLVVMAHGHGGSREEGGGFTQVAEALAIRGVASIRMDFPGCGDSTESFTENNLSNMLIDLQAASAYAASRPSIDSDRTGLLGYSMGGRLVALLSEIDPSYKAMVAWAPAVSDGSEREMVTTFGGPDQYDMHKLRAQQEGSSVYTTQWGTQLEVGPGYFRDIEQSRPQSALAKFKGPLLVIYGDADDAVAPDIAASAASAAVNSSEVSELKIPGAGHGLGFYTNRPEVASQVVESTAEFLAERL
ncbi:MAG: alpha/beta hydrolase family protein [Woeseiaceae bacterium]